MEEGRGFWCFSVSAFYLYPKRDRVLRCAGLNPPEGDSNQNGTCVGGWGLGQLEAQIRGAFSVSGIYKTQSSFGKASQVVQW